MVLKNILCHISKARLMEVNMKKTNAIRRRKEVNSYGL